MAACWRLIESKVPRSFVGSATRIREANSVIWSSERYAIVVDHKKRNACHKLRKFKNSLVSVRWIIVEVLFFAYKSCLHKSK